MLDTPPPLHPIIKIKKMIMNSNPQTICTNIIRHTQNQNIAHFATFPFWPIPTIYAACVNYLRHGNINDSQATSTSRKSTCASEQNEWAWTIFAFIRSDTPISFNVWVGTYEFCLHNMTCLSVTLLQLYIQCSFPFIYYSWHGTIHASQTTGKLPTSR